MQPDRPAPRLDFAPIRAAGQGWESALSANTRQQVRRSLRRYGEAGALATWCREERGKALAEAGAKVALVEFSDYECPFCIRHFTQTMPQIQANYVDTGKIRYVFKDFPIDQLHPGAFQAHVAARCAAEQDRFWDLHRRLFSAPGTHEPPLLTARAQEAGLNVAQVTAALDNHEHQADIDRTQANRVLNGEDTTDTAEILDAPVAEPHTA